MHYYKSLTWTNIMITIYCFYFQIHEWTFQTRFYVFVCNSHLYNFPILRKYVHKQPNRKSFVQIYSTNAHTYIFAIHFLINKDFRNKLRVFDLYVDSWLNCICTFCLKKKTNKVLSVPKVFHVFFTVFAV